MLDRFPGLIQDHVCRVVAVDQDSDVHAAGERAGVCKRRVDDLVRGCQRVGLELQIENCGYRHGCSFRHGNHRTQPSRSAATGLMGQVSGKRHRSSYLMTAHELRREKTLIRFPSGSRKIMLRFPHGCVVGGRTHSTPSDLIRSYSASTSSTRKSRMTSGRRSCAPASAPSTAAAEEPRWYSVYRRLENPTDIGPA